MNPARRSIPAVILFISVGSLSACGIDDDSNDGANAGSDESAGLESVSGASASASATGTTETTSATADTGEGSTAASGAEGSSGGSGSNPVSEECQTCADNNCHPEAEACGNDPGCMSCVFDDYTQPMCADNPAWNAVCECAVVMCADECTPFC